MNNIRKGDFLDISPTNHPPINFSHNDKENTKSVAVLSLVQFSRPPYVSFGTVKLGTTRSEVLCIENPIDDATDVKVDKVASTKGFSVEQTQFIIPAEDSTCLTIHWTPAEEGNVRELITFIANGISKHQAILLGRAEAPKRKKKSLWDSIKQKKAADVSAPFKEKKTNPSLKKAANKTFHVSRQPQYKTERVRSPLRSCNEELVLQERVEVLIGSIENHQERSVQENCTPVPFEKTHVTSAQTRLESVVSSKNSPVVLLVPAAKLFDAGDVTEVPCAVGTPCITDQKNVNRVLNMTHSPICTPEDGGNRLIPRIHSSQSPISSEGKVLSCVAEPFLPGTPVLTVKDALAIIQSDLTELDGASPPNACSSFDFSDSLESVKGNCGADQSPAAPELTEQRVQEVSTELEAVKPRLTFLVIPKTDQVKSFENEANDVVPLNFRKIPFSSSTVTKSRLHPNRESSRTIRKTRTSKRRLLEKTLELSVDSSSKSSLLGQQLVGGLPVIDSDASHDTHDSIRSPLVVMPPSDFSPVRCAHADHFTVSLPPSVAQLDLSPVMATPSCKSQTSVKSDLTVFLNVQHQSEVTSLMPQHDETLVDAQSSVAVPARSLSCSRKRKSDEFLTDKTEKGKPFQVKRSRVFPAAKETKKTIQDRKYSSRSTSQSLHRKTVVSQSSNLAASAVTKAAKSVSVAQTKLPLSKPAPQSLKSFSSSSVKTAKVVAVAQAQLTFIKPAQTVIPRHPLPFAAKNMFYDERWIEKQERGFVWWINYVLTPDDFKVSTEVTKVNAVSLAMGSDSSKCPKAPTKEEMSFRMYTARRRLNSLRRAACKFFTSEAMVKAIQRLELEVEAKRLLVRKDRHLWKDIGERQKILTWLLSYNPLWLRIGLETIFGELIPLESNSDVMGLAVFILNRLLWNPDIAAEFRHPKVPHLYRDGHEEALSRFTLKKLLLLVCFLDKAKESRMIEHDPCLFCMDSEFKTSKDLLLAFARDFLSGEGILSRHLGYLGLAVSHAQVPLDEFNFAVKNLASDLRCGIRLVRVMELFTQDWSLSRKLRMPAISRLQKVHNVELALDVLKAKGVDLKDEHGCAIDARDIVDGHREKTLTLLWKIIFTFQVEVLLDEEQLKEEICFLKRTWRTRQKLDALRANQDVAEKPKEKRPTFQHSNTKITLLMDWVNSVSAFYNSKAENFTVSFSDGQILCYLIHYYHPSHLPLEAVCRKTTQTVECGQQGRVGLNCSSSDSDSSFDTWPGQQNGAGTEASVDFTELLENEKSNFQLVDTAVSYLGGVPAMLHTADMSSTIPNEKVVMSYLSFLCARLLDLRNETRAARIIQGAWRKYRLKMELKHYKESNAAAATIQCAVKRFLQRRRKVRQNAAAIVIQTVWRSYSARQELRRLRMGKLQTLRNSAATVIQAQWRKHLAMKKFQRLKYYTVMMQARLRMKMAVTAYRRILWAARTIQKHRCACLLAKDERAKYLALRSSIIKIQKSYREWKTRIWAKKTNAATVIQRAFRKWQERRLAQKNAAAIKIQSWYRMVKCQKLYKNILQKTINIQAWYRGNKERRNFQFLKLQHSSAVAIQRAFKANILRRRFLEIRQAAIVIQHWFRACRQKESERKQYLEKKRAAITLQAAFRGYLVRKANKELQRASVVIQTAFRMFVARKGFLSLRKAALAVQQQYKAVILGRKLRKEYLDRRRSVVVLQALWRGRAERKKIEGMHKAAVLIQSYYRRYAARSEFKSKRSATLTIQSRYRAHRSGRTTHLRYLRLRKAAVSLQAGFRGMKARQKLRKQHRAATLIQATFKAFTCRRQFLSLKSAATVLQTRYRAHLLAQSHQRQYSLLQQMTVRIQAVYRGSKERRRIRRMHEAATTIQACFRRHKAQVTFAAARCAASIIQQRYRAYAKGKQERKNYLKIRDSVVVMQSAYRGMKVRHQVQEMHRSATVIQAHYRRHIMVVKFQRLRWAATVVGQRFRANQERNVQVSKYAAMKKAAVCIQSAYRGMTTRKRVKTMQEAARVIQLRYTAYREHKRFLAMRSAVIQIQQWYRALIIARLQQKYYYSLRAAAITVQSVYRGMKVRREVQRRHKAATVIQAAFQMYRARMAFKAERLAATIIQRQYRAHLQRKRDQEHFLKLRHSAIVIQSVFRGNKTRREMRKMHEAATTIQACFRRHKAQVTFATARCAASVIQQRYRAYVKGRQERKNYLKIRDSVIVMQSAYRGMKVRHQVQEMHRSATVIQAHYRRHIMVVKFQRLRWAATVVGQRFRANQERNVQVSKYAAMKKAAVCIQSAYRGMTTRKRVKTMQEAARVIHLRYTAYREHKRFLAMRSAVIQIQQWYRALIIARLQQKYYYSLRAAAITVQSVYRGMKVRREVQRRHKAATVIQAAFQMYRARMAFKAERLAAIIIQRQYRAHLQRKRDQEHFLKLRHSAIVIQSVFRGNKTRREMRKMHSAATVIQSQFRMYQCRGSFKKMRWAIMAVQERYRACRVRDSLTQQYRSKKAAALVIQRAFRGHRVRRQVSVMHRAATVIQRRFRTYRDRKRFLSLRAGALLVQRIYRALVAMRTQRKEYLKQCWSTVILQAAYRGMKVRQHLQKEHRAAVMIQAHVRRHLVRSRYLRLQWATKVVQRHFRAQKMMKAEVQSLKEKMAATTLQAAFRGMKTRKHIKQMQGAASAIQRCFRTYRAHRKYLSLKTSVLAIQRRYRSVIATRQQKEHYHRIRSATITLQGAYRGYKTRKEMRQKHAAATVLQAEFRRHRGVVTFQAMRLAAVIIQRHYKSYKQRKEDREKFLMLRNSVIAIQAAFRGQRARRDMAQLHKAAVLIQSNYRMHRQRVAFQRMRWAAAVLQQKFRAQKLRDSQVLLYQQIKKATVCIQTSFRHKQARELLKRERAALKVQSFLRMRVQRRCFLQQRAASVVIQSAFRCYHARVRYAKMQTSSVQIQRWYKSCRLAQKQKAEHLAVRQATVTLQSAFRGVLARRLAARLRAAVKIQSVLQMFWHRKKFLNLRSSTVKIQSHYRMWTARRRFLSYRTAAVTLQKHFRAQQLMKDQRCAYVNTLKSIVTLQAALRGHIEYKNFQRLKRSAVTIQAAFRGHQARRHAKRSQAALKIQAWFRGNVARQKFIAKQKAITTVHRCMQTRLHQNRFQKVRQSVCIIQRRWRETLDARRTHHDFLEMRSSAVKIQALWRGHIIRLNLQKEQKAACVIQSSYRGYVQRKAFQRMKRSVLVLQKHVRALRRGKEDLETFKITKSAVLTIQAFCRGWLVRRQLKEETQTRRRHRFSAAVYHHLCAVKIQRGLRAHWALKSAKRQLHYVIYIQRWIRAKLQKKRYLEKKMKIIKVQRAVRGWLSRRHTAAVVIQRAVKKYLSKKRELRVQRGIIKAQALWRGHRSRKANDTPKVVAIRHRFRKVNQRVKEEDRLCNKTTVAIDYLLRYKHFSYILAALKHLETATRLSPECCEHLVNSGATLVIFTLIRSCNRSVPCMEVITFAIQVLLNLSKYYKTTEAVYAVENSVNTLLDLLQIYREKAGDKVADKGGSIFTKTCFLLAILLQDEQRALEVRNLPKATDRIRSLYFLTARKHKMDTERTVTKLKMNVSLNGSLFTQPTPRKAKARPRIAPDWVLRQDKMKEVVDPLQAIQMVADALTLVP